VIARVKSAADHFHERVKEERQQEKAGRDHGRKTCSAARRDAG